MHKRFVAIARSVDEVISVTDKINMHKKREWSEYNSADKSPETADEFRQRYSQGEWVFRGAMLAGANFRGMDLSGLDLRPTTLFWEDLERPRQSVDLSGTDLREAVLAQSNLEGVILKGALLRGADLSAANLSWFWPDPGPHNRREATLFGADLTDAKLTGTDLTGADLREAVLIRTRMDGATLAEAYLSGTVFVDIDLSHVGGLDSVRHFGPSIIDWSTLAKSKGLPVNFLRGVGLADWQIEEAKLLEPDLTPHEVTEILYRVSELRSAEPLQIRPVFISYSHADNPFVDALEFELEGKGIRFWRDVHELTAGRIEDQLHEAIRDRVVLIVLSETSVTSEWVEFEVRRAREIQREQKRDALCPIALDESWKSARWPQRILDDLKEFNVLDFSCWRDRPKMTEMFVRLERGLRKWYR